MSPSIKLTSCCPTEERRAGGADPSRARREDRRSTFHDRREVDIGRIDLALVEEGRGRAAPFDEEVLRVLRPSSSSRAGIGTGPGPETDLAAEAGQSVPALGGGPSVTATHAGTSGPSGRAGFPGVAAQACRARPGPRLEPGDGRSVAGRQPGRSRSPQGWRPSGRVTRGPGPATGGRKSTDSPRGHGGLTVEGHRPLGRHVRPAGRRDLRWEVQAACGLGLKAHFDRHPGLAELFEPPPATLGKGSAHRNHHAVPRTGRPRALEASCRNGDAAPGSRKRQRPGPPHRLGQCHNLGVRTAGPHVMPDADPYRHERRPPRPSGSVPRPAPPFSLRQRPASRTSPSLATPTASIATC